MTYEEILKEVKDLHPVDKAKLQRELYLDVSLNDTVKEVWHMSWVYEAESKVEGTLMRDKKLECIKHIKNRTGWGLKESKDYYEALMAHGVRGVTFKSIYKADTAE